MEWIDSLSKARLRDMIREWSIDDPSINLVIRASAQQPIDISKEKFLLTSKDDGLPPNIPVMLKKKKTEEWIKNCESFTLPNTVRILRAISQAVCESILNGFRPEGELLFNLLDAWERVVISKFKYHSEEQKLALRLELLKYHSVIGIIEYEPEEEGEEEEEEEEEEEKAQDSSSSSQPEQADSATTEKDEEEEEGWEISNSFLCLAEMMTSAIGDDMPPIPPSQVPAEHANSSLSLTVALTQMDAQMKPEHTSPNSESLPTTSHPKPKTRTSSNIKNTSPSTSQKSRIATSSSAPSRHHPLLAGPSPSSLAKKPSRPISPSSPFAPKGSSSSSSMTTSNASTSVNRGRSPVQHKEHTNVFYTAQKPVTPPVVKPK
ncbi:uncharacterized protein MONOS_7621 [Monocercomonoides exilis]|uniref:uncharacterized protein n=1 Tax=Monocercomonoides exilis TaxID=2049356 RepID=UPI00355AB24C|nr:hypothetical protein MONOS_7621 [Monocercomonoides exilis]|eukprot:MONOS_7621.1-p1 / transcript=MONOS_7621.1 / gene=MONOS_7621 / organism=Monocercomonoides_exilis_PA203 / gene_product=unspecified product / transcript_product=unspecified product / location=Mono_scaffold00265:52486-53671(+) / protein_length=376 / sequence_SO=supercontig / SO=protein_coding / is_pseudo=false